MITGASNGLGQALALGYASPGVTLFLCALDEKPLAAVAAACRERGARTESQVVDVRDRQAMASWVQQCDATVPLELVIANAGISAGSVGRDSEDDELTRAIFATNLDGMVNTVQPAIAAMRTRRRGQIALLSSLAGYRGMRRSAAYCASKAAVRVFGEGLRQRLAEDGIGVSVVCPSYLAIGNTTRRRGRIGAEAAVRTIRRGLARNRGLIPLPWGLAFAARVLAALPNRLLEWLLGRGAAGAGTQPSPPAG